MVNFYFNIITLISLCFIARYIEHNTKFIYALLSLSIIDVLWAVVSLFLNKFKNCLIFYVWGSLNLTTGIITFTILFLGFSTHSFISIFLFITYFIVAIADYVLCRSYYFYD